MKKMSHNDVTWIDIQKPTQSDLDKLKNEFKLNPFIEEQFLPPIHRPKIEEFPGQLFMALHFPVYKKNSKDTRNVELDLIVLENTLITSHAGSIPELQNFIKECEEKGYQQSQYFKSTGTLLFELLDHLIDECLPMLDHIGEKIEKIENNVFKGKEKEMVMEIAMVKKDLIDFRRAIKPQRSVLDMLNSKSTRLFDPSIKPMAQEVVGSIIRVWNVLENNRELIGSIERTNNSLLSHKLSDIMKFLTVVSFITFPLSVIVGFFGMNIYTDVPFVKENPFAWLYILGLMFVTTTIMVAYFRKKKWL